MNRVIFLTILALVFVPTTAISQSWQQGFDFRNTANYVNDGSGSTYVLSTTSYPTTVGGVTFGWASSLLVQARDRSTTLDPRLAGMNYAKNGSPAKFYVDLPAAGTYNVSLAMGDAGYTQCWTQCQIQFLDGSSVVGSVSGGQTSLGYFYDAAGHNWSAAQWPGSNQQAQITMSGTRLTVVVGTSTNDGYVTPVAFLSLAQVSATPNFTIAASPSSLSIQQGNQGTSTITTNISGGFSSPISLSATGAPVGTTVSFNPTTIPAPGSGSSAMTIAVGSSTPVGTYPITVTGNGGGIQHSATVTLTVTAPQQPDFTLTMSPASLNVAQGSAGNSTATTTVLGGFNAAITLSATGAPTGTTISFNPTTIPAPGAGTSTMTMTVGSSTPLGTYAITVTGNGGGIQHNATVMLTVTSSVWQQGFDFRNTSTYVTDPAGSTYVLSTTAYPTTVGGVTFGWANSLLVQARDRSTTVDPRLAGINYATNGSPAKFYVDLPSPGTYNLSLALGDAGYTQCWTQCQIQFLDGSTVVGTVTGGQIALGHFFDATGHNWSAAQWPANNLPAQVTMSGTRLTVVVGTSTTDGYVTPVAFLGIAQTTATPNFTIGASPSSLSVQQGNQGTSTITTNISGGFSSPISLSAAGAPVGTTVSFNPTTIPAPGSGSSAMTITVGSSTPVGTYPITVTGNGGGIQHSATVTLTVTAPQQPDFTLTMSPASLNVAQGSAGNSTATTTVLGGFNAAITLSATGAPTGTTISFNPTTIPAPGAGTSTMAMTVGSSTPLGTYAITVTANGGGIQHNATVMLTVTSSVWQQGFDFRNTFNYVNDPPGSTYVLPSMSYPTTVGTATFGWVNTSLVQGSNRSTTIDPRLAGINYAKNGAPAKFYVDLPSPGTYSLSLAMGDAGYTQCWTQCQVQFLDGSTVVATVSGGQTGLGYFYDATGRNWSAATWPANNLPAQVTMTGSRLTVVVGTSNNSGDLTPVAYLGVTQLSSVSGFTMTASPSSLTVPQGTQGSSTLTTTIASGFNNAISLSAAGAPAGTTVSLNPSTIPAPGNGSSTVTITVATSTAPGTYPITITGTGGGVRQISTINLTVVAGTQPDFNIAVAPGALNIAQGTQGAAHVYTNALRGFNSGITLSATGAPSGATVTFNPTTIPAPGGGSSSMAMTIAASTAPGTYVITVTGNGGGVQHSATVSLTVTSSTWQQGFDFRGTANFVTDPPGASYVLAEDIYPTTGQLATFGWQAGARVSASNRSTSLDPRLAGVNFVSNGSPAAFYVDLPAPGTYSLSLAMGDAGYTDCWTQCQIQILDGSRVITTITKTQNSPGYFYDAQGNSWSSAAWPANNVPVQVTVTGTQLTALVGGPNNSGDSTPIAYLGLTQVSSGPTFALEAPSAISVGQGDYGTTDLSTVLIGSFNSAISLSATGAPSGVTISFNPVMIAAPGAGSSVITVTVPSGIPLGSYPLTVTASGGGVIQNATVTLNVTAPTSPDFALLAPQALAVAQGSQSSAAIQTTITGNFNNSISLSATGAPSGTTVSFSPTTIPAPGAGSSVITITVPSGTKLGSYPITVTGISGGVSHNATVVLTISTVGNVNLPPGTGWLQLGSGSNFCNQSPGSTYFNPAVGQIDALDFLSLCEGGTMIAYSGGAADIVGDRFFLWTTGHNNYQGNEMYEMDLRGSSPAVSRITDPAWTVVNTDVPPDCACRGTNNCGQGMWHDGAGNSVPSPFAEANYGGPKFESIPAPDGGSGQPSCGYGSAAQPNARETYAGIVYDPSRQKLFSWGGVPAADPTGTGMFSNWSLDLTQNPPKWARLADSSYIWYTSAVYDYTTGHSTSGYDLVFDQGETLYAYNPNTDHYTVLSNTIPYLGYNTNMELDPVHHVVVLENGDDYGGYHIKLVNLDSCNGTSCTITSLDQQMSCRAAMGYWAGLAWDSKRNVMALFPSATNCSGAGCTAPFNTAYLLNTDPTNPVTITYQGSPKTIAPQQCFAASYGSQLGVDYPPMSAGVGVYSRFKYFPNEDIYLFVQHPNQGVWVLRLE